MANGETPERKPERGGNSSSKLSAWRNSFYMNNPSSAKFSSVLWSISRSQVELLFTSYVMVQQVKALTCVLCSWHLPGTSLKHIKVYKRWVQMGIEKRKIFTCCWVNMRKTNTRWKTLWAAWLCYWIHSSLFPWKAWRSLGIISIDGFCKWFIWLVVAETADVSLLLSLGFIMLPT